MNVEENEAMSPFKLQSPRQDPQSLFVVLQNKVHLRENLNFIIDGFSVYIILNGIVTQTVFHRTLNTQNN
jgi:hypothetical protein